MSGETTQAIREDLVRQVLQGERLDARDLHGLATLKDILALGALADDARRRRHGARTTFVRVHEIQQTSPDSWLGPALAAAGEVRVVGRPTSLESAVECVRQAKHIAGTRPVRGFALEDLAAVSPAGGAEESFARLNAAGLSGVAFVVGGAASAPLVLLARASGLDVNVIATERPVSDPVAWLLDTRVLQDAVGGFEVIAPLPRVSDVVAPTTGFHDVRLVALARLALEHVPRIQVDWARYGPKLAQVALTVGADDLDSVSGTDDPALGPRRTALEDVRRNIAAAGLTPIERDGRFNVVA